MAFVPPKDRVLERSTTTGNTGPYALSGAVDTSFNAFSAWMANGDTTVGSIVEPGVAFWTGLLTYSSTTGIAKTGSAFDSKGTFGSGTKEIFMGMPAASDLITDGASALSVTKKAQGRSNLGMALSTRTVYLSGSGTYTTPANCVRLRVRMVGGGGGGGNGYAGGDTTFGTSLLKAGGGSGQSGGTAVAQTGDIALTGGDGGAANYTSGNVYNRGGDGASSPFGGSGQGGYATTAGNNAKANTGAGGGGGSTGPYDGYASGPGGGAGAFVDAWITSPLATYSYAVGGGGNGGSGGGGTYGGGNGGSGGIWIEEFYS